MDREKTTFLQIPFWTGDEESPQHFLIIIPIQDGIPKNGQALIVKFPRAPWQFLRYPHALN
jgi:hypothetical protein